MTKEAKKEYIKVNDFWPVADALGLSLTLKEDGVVTLSSSNKKTRKYSDMGVELMMVPDIYASNYTKDYMWVYLNIEGALALFVTFDTKPKELFMHVVNSTLLAATPAHIDGKPLSEAFGEVWNAVIASYGWDAQGQKWVKFNAEDLFVVEGQEGEPATDDTASAAAGGN